MSQAEPFSSRHHLTLELGHKAPLFSHNPYLPPLGLDLITSSQLTPTMEQIENPEGVLGSTLPAHLPRLCCKYMPSLLTRVLKELRLKPMNLAAQVGGLLSTIPLSWGSTAF